MKQKGKLIVLEGVDGVGKTTLAFRLKAKLEKTNSKVGLFSFPGRIPGFVGAEIYDMHHRLKFISPASLQLLHIAAHIDAIERELLPWLDSDGIVILDRYWWSTWVYGKCAGVPETALESMIQLELDTWRGRHPDCIILLERRDCEDGEIVTTQKRSREYRELAQKRSKFHPIKRVSNDGTIESTLQLALNHIFLSKAPVKSRPANPLAPAVPTPVYQSYWKFAAERQRIFFQRFRHTPAPWTEDPVLRHYKFTNAYRASDRVSQYLIQNVIYKGDQSIEEIFFRVILFKLFNRIETWEMLEQNLGEIRYDDYAFRHYNKVLDNAMSLGKRIYSAAYIMPSGGRQPGGGRKHSMHLRLLDTMMKEGLPGKIAAARSMGKAFELIRAYPTIGDFLAYQYVTDLNYSTLTNYTEMEFVVPGPGALSGIHKCFSSTGGLTESELIKLVTERQDEEFKRLGIQFDSLWGRRLQLIDCQNLFCEVDKYARVAHPEFTPPGGRARIKQKFTPQSEPLVPWYPPKWGINDRIRL